MKPKTTDTRRQTAMTLLEILLSLALVGITAAYIGTQARIAFQDARMAKDIVQAELLAESIMAKIRLGIIELEPVFEQAVGSTYSNPADFVMDTHATSQGNITDILWYYSIDIVSIDDPFFNGYLDDYLVEVAVTVRQNVGEGRRGVACRLVRWIAIEPEIEEEEEQVES